MSEHTGLLYLINCAAATAEHALEGYMNVAQRLIQEGYRSYLTGFSALDRYYGLKPPGMVSLATDADLVHISSLFDDISYPSINDADVIIDDQLGDIQYLIRSLEQEKDLFGRLRHTSFWYDLSKNSFQDPCNIYWDLRSPGVLEIPPITETIQGTWEVAADAAVLVSRYGFTLDEAGCSRLQSFGQRSTAPLATAEQRILIIRLLSSAHPARGLRLLMDCGFIHEHWKLLAAMRGVEQNKEYHPEGDVWEHTLETFSHLKNQDTAVSLALLLHDAGKAFSSPNGKNTFDRHAQLGAGKAVRFLKDLGFEDTLIENVSFLVKEHMLPSFLTKLPVYRTKSCMDSPFFPQLLEVYRCDVSSTFRGLDEYYQACEMYRKYVKHKKNPFRNNDGTRRNLRG